MASAEEPLKVDPAELRVAAEQIDGQASDFQTSQQAAQARAGKAVLGSGLAAAALPGMLAGWEADATRFGKHFATTAEGHRTAAASYVRTDTESAAGIDDAASKM